MAGLDAKTRAEFLETHPGWSLDAETITKTFVLENFNQAMGFVTRVALAAEVADHHPDIDIRWNRVTVSLSTHEAGALTAKDTTLATQIDHF